jgi:hypothetical protein
MENFTFTQVFYFVTYLTTLLVYFYRLCTFFIYRLILKGSFYLQPNTPHLHVKHQWWISVFPIAKGTPCICCLGESLVYLMWKEAIATAALYRKLKFDFSCHSLLKVNQFLSSAKPLVVWLVQITHWGKIVNTYKIWIRKIKEVPRHRREDNIKIWIESIIWGLSGFRWRAVVNDIT